jgi:hypothetical protein
VTRQFQDDELFDEVDDDTYREIVKKRQKESFVVDDSGS